MDLHEKRSYRSTRRMARNSMGFAHPEPATAQRYAFDLARISQTLISADANFPRRFGPTYRQCSPLTKWFNERIFLNCNCSRPFFPDSR
jgi:hypothetical protein